MNQLAGKVALVTGAASGIGRATAIMMAAAGASVIVSDRDADGGAETVASIREIGGAAEWVAADVTQANAVEHLVMATVQTYGRLDCAFNNAGVGGQMSPVVDKEEAEWDLVLAVNLKAVWLCMKYQIPAMIANGTGAIVNMASVAGLIGFRNASAYSASKHGVIGLTKSAALEVARRGIRVNAVCPGFTDTPMVSAMVDFAPIMGEAVVSNPMRRMGQPDEIAEAVVWLCSDAASFITGQSLAIDGGMTAM